MIRYTLFFTHYIKIPNNILKQLKKDLEVWKIKERENVKRKVNGRLKKFNEREELR